MFGVSGDKELLKKMDNLSKAVRNKIGKKAVTAGVKIMAKAIKKEIPSNQKSARKAIGYSFKRPGSGRYKNIIFAKAGAGAGMKKEKRRKIEAQRRFNRKSKKKGVGIGVSNVHWLLAGTDKRYTGTKRGGAHKAGNKRRVDTGKKKKYTGRVKRSGIVQRAERTAKSAVAAVIKGQVMVGIDRELAKA